MLSLFNAPSVITNIKEIKTIYEKNEKQGKKLREDIKKIETNLSLDTATEELIAEWEQILKIKKSDLDTLEDRRFRVKSRKRQKIPYTYRTLKRKLNEMCGIGGYELQVNIDEQEVICYVSLERKILLKEVNRLLEDIVPLNMTLDVQLKYNKWKDAEHMTWEEGSRYTWEEVKEVVLHGANQRN